MNSVKWGEYKLGDLFDARTGDVDIQKKHITSKGEWVVTAGLTNNGILGKTKLQARVFPANTITVDMFGCAFYRQFPYKMVTHARVFALVPKFKMTDKQGLFLAASLGYLKALFGYSNMCSWDKIKNNIVYLPDKNVNVNFDFMEDFIAELEKGYINKLWRYLDGTVPDGCSLTDAEKDALQKDVVWEKFTFRSIFDHIKQGRRLKKEDQLPGAIPFVMAGTGNNGVANYVANPVATFPANSITIDIFGNTFYRNYPFGAGDDTGVYWSAEKTYSLNTMLFLAATMQTAVKGKFSYGHKLRSSQSLNLSTSLPTTNGEPDFTYMDNYISAVKKMLLADVVRYVAEKTGVPKP